jgi:hypothetical protein
MWSDPIVKETRRARGEVIAPFGEDIHRFFEYIREREQRNGTPTVTLEPNPPEILTTHAAAR